MLTHLPVTLTATQENMDLFTLTLAWLDHTVTVLGHTLDSLILSRQQEIESQTYTHL